MKLIYDNAADRAVLTASPAMVATLPVTNLQRMEREYVARTTGLTPQTIGAQWPSGATVSGVALWRGNFSAGSTWRVYAYDSAAKNSLLHDSGTLDLVSIKPLGDLDWGVDPLGVTLFSDWDFAFAEYWLPVVVAPGYVEVLITDAQNPDGYVQFSRLVIGKCYEPRNMPQAGMSHVWKDTSTQDRTEGGGVHVDRGYTYRSLSFSGVNMPEADRIELATLLRTAGAHRDVYLSPYAGLGTALWRDYAMLALQNGVGASSTPLYGLINQTFQFDEV